MTRLDLALREIEAARRYTRELLAATDDGDWFRQPAGGVTHIAWQVGHLAMAEYRLALDRVRGANEDDEALISPEFLAAFGRGSQPTADANAYPAAEEIRRVFDGVHQRVMEEIPFTPDEHLDLPPLTPHRLFNTRLESLFWCARHEMAHAGQIGLLRRLLGYAPVW